MLKKYIDGTYFSPMTKKRQNKRTHAEWADNFRWFSEETLPRNGTDVIIDSQSTLIMVRVLSLYGEGFWVI